MARIDRSLSYVPTFHRTKRDGLEYLDLCTDLVARSLASCRSKMHSQSQLTCDCYCKTRVPIAQQREEIRSERSRIRGSRSSVSKTETIRSAKKIPLISAKVIYDEQLDSKRSTVTPPVSPVLSPDTTAAFENVEKLIKDTQIQLKEINRITTSCGRHQKCQNVYTDEASLDDENDQLLYIRERVTYKFQEANNWIDVNPENQRFSNKERAVVKPKRTVDLSAPKFKTSEDCYEKFLQQRKLEIQKLGFSVSTVNNEPENIENVKKDNDHRVCSFKQEAEKNKKVGACSIQIGPSVNIKGELITQNLGSIHISPDPSFVQESENVGTYMIYHTFHKRNGSPRRKEKVVKILEDNKNGTKSENGKLQKRNTSDCDNARGDDFSSTRTNEELEKASEESLHVLIRNNEKMVENVVETFESEKSLESFASKALSTNYNDITLGKNTKELIQGTSNTKSETNINKEETDDLIKVKLTCKTEQKQVRFDEQTLGTEKRENNIEMRGKEVDSTILQQDFQMPAKSVELEKQKVVKDSVEQFNRLPSLKSVTINDESVPLSSKEIEETHMINKKRHKEICEKRKVKKQEYYARVKERFANIAETYRDGAKKCFKHCSNVTISSNTNSSEDSEESGYLHHLYEPSIDEIDDVLTAYDKMINNAIQSTGTIEKFLSRPELQEYRVQNIVKTNQKSTTSRKFLNLIPLNETKIEKAKKDNLHKNRRVKQDTEFKIKSATNKEKLPVRNKGIEEEWKFDKSREIKETTSAPLKMSVAKDDKINLKKQRIALKHSDNVSTFSKNLKTKERFIQNASRNFSSIKTAGSSGNNSKDNKLIVINEVNQVRPFEMHSLETVNYSSSLTTSSTCPLSSSTDTRTANETRVSQEISKSQIEEEIGGRAMNLNNLNDRIKLRKIIYSDILKQIFPETKSAEHLIGRVFREETRLIKDEIKNIFDINQVVSSVVKSLMESLKCDPLNFGNLALLISGNEVANSSNTASTNIQLEEKGSDNEFKIQDLKNCIAAETIKYEEKVIEENISDKSVHEENIVNESVSNSEIQSSLRKNENRDTRTLKGNSSPKNGEIDGDKDISKIIDDENIISKGGINLTRDENNEHETLMSTEVKISQVINEHVESKEYQIGENSHESSALQNISDKNTVPNEINRISVIAKSNENKDLKCKKSEILNKKLSLENDGVSELKEQKFIELNSVENAEKSAVRSNNGNNVTRTSSSDSLPEHVSPRFLKNVAKASSNEMEPSSQKINKPEQTSETSNVIGGKTIYVNNLHFNNALEKEKILFDVYNEVHKRFSTSTHLDSNYSSMHNQQYSAISTISTTESNKTGISSDTSYSEGELYMPSSGSYSLGEIRTLTKSRSDGENSDGLIDNTEVFITKKMLTSWHESSKSLVQSMGEI